LLIRCALQSKAAYGGEFPEFPGAGAKPSVEMQQKGVALQKPQIPAADELGDYVHTLAGVTVKVFGEAARGRSGLLYLDLPALAPRQEPRPNKRCHTLQAVA